jgi:hypothetical protein
MARGSYGGFGVGGILVLVGVAIALVWSWWPGVIVTLIGLVAFGGFAKGRWY